MRSLLAGILALFFGYTLIAPSLAATEKAQLPACCRRDGAHHCAMAGMEAEGASPRTQFGAIHGRCPLYPRALISFHPGVLALAAAAFLAGVVRYPAVFSWTQAERSISSARSHYKRGPPALHSRA